MTAAADRIRNRRQAFAAPGSTLDRMVRTLAFVLPALVGVVVALMVITPLSPRGDVSFLLDRNKVAIAEDRMRVDNAMYRGSDSRGRPFSLVAGEAVQESNTRPQVLLQDLIARILLDEGPAQLSAAIGSYNMEREQVTVPGLVRFTAADGYAMAVNNVLVDLTERTLQGRGGVRGEIPAGNFSADTISADLAERTLLLDGNARLQMVPGQLRTPGGVE